MNIDEYLSATYPLYIELDKSFVTEFFSLIKRTLPQVPDETQILEVASSKYENEIIQLENKKYLIFDHLQMNSFLFIYYIASTKNIDIFRSYTYEALSHNYLLMKSLEFSDLNISQKLFSNYSFELNQLIFNPQSSYNIFELEYQIIQNLYVTYVLYHEVGHTLEIKDDEFFQLLLEIAIEYGRKDLEKYGIEKYKTYLPSNKLTSKEWLEAYDLLESNQETQEELYSDYVAITNMINMIKLDNNIENELGVTRIYIFLVLYSFFDNSQKFHFSKLSQAVMNKTKNNELLNLEMLCRLNMKIGLLKNMAVMLIPEIDIKKVEKLINDYEYIVETFVELNILTCGKFYVNEDYFNQTNKNKDNSYQELLDKISSGLEKNLSGKIKKYPK